jgi:hypothetical protein
MPQATDELSKKWGNTDEKAWEQLAGKVVEVAGMISFRKRYVPTDDDWSAVTYLCQEWDYDYKPYPDRENDLKP